MDLDDGSALAENREEVLHRRPGTVPAGTAFSLVGEQAADLVFEGFGRAPNGDLTLGKYMQAISAFEKVQSSLSVLMHRWIDINELRAVGRRLQEFEALLPTTPLVGIPMYPCVVTPVDLCVQPTSIDASIPLSTNSSAHIRSTSVRLFDI